MRFDHLRIHNVGPFRDVELDLSAIPGKLVAVTGPNGAGKSTLLELLPAALYRACPTRGSLTELATARDSSLEARVQNGSAYTIRQSADGLSKKSEGTILQAGEPLIASAKVRELDAWVASHFPAPEVLYASSFLSQGSEGFLELSAADRKRVLLRLLQIERYEAMAERARERHREAKAAWQTANARLADARSTVPVLEAAQAELQQAELSVAESEAAALAARAQLATVRDHAALREAAAQRTRERLTVQHRITQTQAAIRILSERIANNQLLISRKPEILDALERQQAASLREQELAILVSQHEAKRATQRAVADAAQDKHQRANQAQNEAHERLTALCGQLSDASAIARAVEELPRVRGAASAASNKLVKLDAQLQSLRALAVDVRDKRIVGLRDGLEHIRDGANAPSRVAAVTLAADDEVANEAQGAPKRLAEAETQYAAAGLASRKADAKLAETKALAARAKDVENTRKLIEKAELQLTAACTETTQADVASRAANELERKLKALCASLATEHKRVQELLRVLKPVCDLAPKLEAASARLEELQPQLQQAESGLALDQQALAELPEIHVPKLDAASVQRAATAADQALAQTHRRVALAAENVARATRGQAELLAREAAVIAHADDMADWSRLGADLGKDGLQALEIDAALPELTTLTNDLLHTCHGARFTVELRTDRASADGKRTLEDLDVRVIDTERGRDARGETYSGGERVIVSEALSLALTMLACRRAGLVRPTIVRDETGAALDQTNGRAYIAMLRRAAEILDADKVLFVTHSAELQELADARIAVGNGTATVQ